MVSAARQLLREQGYHATAMSEVLKRSEAPRGSVYFHFPGGKAQLAEEAANEHLKDQLEHIDRMAAEATSPVELVRGYVGLARKNLLASSYQEGCALAPIVIESAELGDLGGRAFLAIIERLASHFQTLGLDPKAARQLADASVAGMEGALITARALHSPAPFEAVLAVLENHVAKAD